MLRRDARPHRHLDRVQYASGAKWLRPTQSGRDRADAAAAEGDGTRYRHESDADIQQKAEDRARTFREEAPTTAAQAAKIILDGVKAGQWRILVGDDAHRLDARVRETPEKAYTPEFYESFVKEVGWRIG
jgi:hypothetical protein